eukprot:11223242-Lingulodinium_polyedra.AAC.1
MGASLGSPEAFVAAVMARLARCQRRGDCPGVRRANRPLGGGIEQTRPARRPGDVPGWGSPRRCSRPAPLRRLGTIAG